MSEAQILIENMERLADLFSRSITELLHGFAASPTAAGVVVPDAVVQAALVNGCLVGLLDFMAEMSSLQRMDDPNGHLTQLFVAAANCWDDIRAGRPRAGRMLQ